MIFTLARTCMFHLFLCCFYRCGSTLNNGYVSTSLGQPCIFPTWHGPPQQTQVNTNQYKQVKANLHQHQHPYLYPRAGGDRGEQIQANMIKYNQVKENMKNMYMTANTNKYVQTQQNTCKYTQCKANPHQHQHPHPHPCPTRLIRGWVGGWVGL